MSKLVDKLKQLSRVSAPPIGFRAASSLTQGSSMLLIATLTQPTGEAAKAAGSSAVDAALIPGKSLNPKDLKQLVSTLRDVPVGVSLEGVNLEDITKIIKSGCDFVVFGTMMPLGILETEDIGKILEVKPSFDQGLVKTINELQLPVDGVLIGGEGESYITIERLLIYQRFADLLDKPLLVTLPPSVSGNELGSLWEAGVDGVIVAGEQPLKTLTELKKAIDSLPRGTKRRGKTVVVLPRATEEVGLGVVEEEEEEI